MKFNKTRIKFFFFFTNVEYNDFAKGVASTSTQNDDIVSIKQFLSNHSLPTGVNDIDIEGKTNNYNIFQRYIIIIIFFYQILFP